MFGKESTIEDAAAEESGGRMTLVDSEGSNIVPIVIVIAGNRQDRPQILSSRDESLTKGISGDLVASVDGRPSDDTKNGCAGRKFLDYWFENQLTDSDVLSKIYCQYKLDNNTI